MDLIFTYYITENELRGDICGYLKIENEKVPLFEKAMRLDESGENLTGYLEHFWEMKENKHEKLAKIPVVDYYEKILFDCLLFAFRRLNLSLKYKPFWQDGKKFAMCLTHDVDRVHKSYQYITHFLRHLKGRDLV